MPAGGFAFLIVAFLFFVLSIAIPLWVYSDAQRNSADSALLWALVVFFGNLLGLLLYLLIGRDGGGGRGGTRSQF